MKKELNGKSRRKFVVGGAMVFGSIALLSTGFATWVIGAANGNATGDLNISIDDVKNESLTVTADVTEGAIKIVDPENTTGIVTTDGTGRDLEFTVKLTAKFSEDYGMVGDVTPSFFIPEGGVAGNKILKSTIDGCHTGLAPGTDWATARGTISGDYYSIFADSINVKEGTGMDSGWSVKAEASAGVYTSERTITYVLSIGDIWGSTKTFCGLVNSIYSSATTSTDLFGEIETEMEEEIAKIKGNFADGKLKIQLAVAKATA